MNRLIVAIISLSLGLAGMQGAALAQVKDAPVVMTNATGTCVTSPAGGSPGANGTGWTITCGDINPGVGMTVIGPPASSTAPVPVPVTAAPVTPSGSAPADAAVATPEDLDADNYADALEAEIGLDPGNPDTDADGVADGDEPNIYGTDPMAADTDGDGLTDGQELFATHTDPLVWNDASSPSPQAQAQQAAFPVQILGQEGRVVIRGQESTEILTADDGNAAALGTGNASAAPGTVTRDGVIVPGTSLLGPDGIYRVTETSPPVVNVTGGTSAPPVVTGPTAAPAVTETVATEPAPAETTTAVSETDQDGDNYADALEWEIGLDANNPDGDGDSVADGDEITIYGTDPFAWDTDGDGLSDGQELFAAGTDPLAWDTNGDGLSDAENVSTLSGGAVDTTSGA